MRATGLNKYFKILHKYCQISFMKDCDKVQSTCTSKVKGMSIFTTSSTWIISTLKISNQDTPKILQAIAVALGCLPEVKLWTFFFHVYVCSLFCIMCSNVCGCMGVCRHMVSRPVDVLLDRSPPICWDIVCHSYLWLISLASQASQLALLFLFQDTGLQVDCHGHTAFTWVLGIWNWVVRHVRWTLYSLSHLSGPIVAIFVRTLCSNFIRIFGLVRFFFSFVVDLTQTRGI